ncbi:MAG: hypothetical protein IJ210_03085 [Clostridia bacterium]|nr:hypothetical protein [Clostridia bacterium]
MRETLRINTGWKFFFGEPEWVGISRAVSDQSYRMTRAASARGPARRDFDDEHWETVSIPHDFVAFNGISRTEPHGGEHYAFPMDRGSAWYRRTFLLSEEDRDKRITLYFEGVGTKCEVYLNAMLLKVHFTAGIGFEVDITDAALFGECPNVLAVYCECHDFEAWYYEGGGITRSVCLTKTDRVCVPLWGTFVKTSHLEGETWEADVETELISINAESRPVQVLSRIVDEAGETCAEALSDLQDVPGRGGAVVHQTLPVPFVRPWSPEEPHLYRLRTEVVCEGNVIDTVDTTFGFRELRYDAEHGLFVNGKKTTIYGFANHMTYLGVGEALSDSMAEYQIRTLREMGSNGYRTAHSPHPEAVMDWCDRYGQLVMDENRCFRSSDICLDEVRSMVRRDRNHPSVCMWSVFNEEDFVTCDTGKRIFRHLKEEIRKLDPTRPVTGAISYGMFSEGMHEDYDLFGFNHQTMHFDALHHLHPDKPIFCSEMIFPLGCREHTGKPAVCAGEDARQLEKEYIIGGFHFTAWRYGPERAEILGMDGTPGTGYYGFRAYLRRNEPFCHVCPGWDFPGKEGQEVELHLANNGDECEVFINDDPPIRVKTDFYRITPLKVRYTPGTIRVISWKDGKRWAEDTAVTPGEPAGLELVCENRQLAADGADTAIVSAYIVDREGRRCLHESGRMVHFASSAEGELLTTLTLREDGFQGKVGADIRTFDGKCQAIYRSLEGGGSLKVTVTSPGLKGASLEIPRAAGKIPQLPLPEQRYITSWRISDALPEDTVDAEVMGAHMTERWKKVGTIGTPEVQRKRGGDSNAPLHYAYYATSVVPEMGQGLPALRFEGLDGRADVTITDGERTVHRLHPSDSPWFGHYRPEMIVPCEGFRPGDRVEIWVFLHGAGRIHGIGWPVHWMVTTREAIDALEQQTDREWHHCEYRE